MELLYASYACPVEFKFSQGTYPDPYPSGDLWRRQSERFTKGAGTVWEFVKGYTDGWPSSFVSCRFHTVDYTVFYGRVTIFIRHSPEKTSVAVLRSSHYYMRCVP